MAYTKNSFVDFTNLKLTHFHGWSHTTVMEDAENFITSNPSYRYVDAWVNYLHPLGVTAPIQTIPADSYWVEVTILYTEG